MPTNPAKILPETLQCCFSMPNQRQGDSFTGSEELQEARAPWPLAERGSCGKGQGIPWQDPSGGEILELVLAVLTLGCLTSGFQLETNERLRKCSLLKFFHKLLPSFPPPASPCEDRKKTFKSFGPLLMFCWNSRQR